MNKTVGLDLGTNSIGISIRDTDNGSEIVDQLEYFSSVIFKSGVGKEKNAEFSFAAKRTEKRSTRRLYQARKYRIWSTLKLLIENNCCPLSMEDLEKWSRYDKAQGLKRQYPIHATDFEQWVRLDFDGDGVADYSSPFQLRAELMEKQFDFSNQVDRYKLGRALYHIAQRRGFRSSKGETIKEQEKNETEDIAETDLSEALKKSEKKISGKLDEYMKENNLPTVGCAFYHLEKKGIRVRNSEYQAVRSQYKDEIEQIFDFQKGLDKASVFFKRLVSEKKGEGSIFYKRPLRSQKGTVGNCTLEPNKPRCPISHPEFEKFRAWCLINNIKFGEELKETLTIEQKEQLYNDVFLKGRIDKNGIFRIDSSFKFQKIRVWIEKQTGKKLDEKTINYKDKTTVSGCPISGRLKNLLGENWENWKYSSGKEKHIIKKIGDETVCKTKVMEYYAKDLWHVCFYSSTFDDSPDFIKEFAVNKLQFDDNQTNQLIYIYDEIQQGYAMLSLKAIKNINRFLQKGLIYTDAVLLAKLPDIFKDKWEDAEEDVIAEIDRVINNNRKQKQLFNIVNTLIANYKSLEITEQFANKNYDYKLDSYDLKDVREMAIKAIGEKTWAKKDVAEQDRLLNDVADLYQNFFASEKRDYYKLPRVADALKEFLLTKYEFLSEKDLRKIYHPSMIEFYAPAKYTQIEDGRLLRLLGSPVIGALKNPMAMRVLHTLRIQLNKLLKEKDKYGNALIDEDTRVVVETAKELNDANMRWAIETYQREREAENKEYEKLIKEFYPARSIKDNDLDIARFVCEQHDILEINAMSQAKTKKELKEKDLGYKKDVTKYRLWLEQGCRCLYTGKIINITNLFDDNAFDIEHTIPRSLSFDDSLPNLTICDAHFNRTVKKNQMPTQLANYEEIKLRLQPWFDKVEQLKDNVDFWKAQSKRAQTKERKDHCIQQKHLWQMELDYWQNKVDRFTMTEVTTGFRNNQLNDTRIITKYAYHYLKTVFNKVEVQKGDVTSKFRKMLGVQSVDEKKDRDKHSHHAIDATILTLIPTAAKRDKMLELFFSIQEKKRFDENTAELERELEKEIKNSGLSGHVSEIVPFIENSILVNHVSNDRTLMPAKRKARVRGKEVLVKSKQGELVNKWIKGDSIRGQLHGESYYGAIRLGKKDEKGNLLRDKDGSIIFDEKFVIRRDLKYKKNDNDKGFKNWDELEKVIVDKELFNVIKKQFPEDTSFKEACEKGIFMYRKNKEGEIDYSEGCKVNKIRHIRCYTSVKKPLEIKYQTYLSDKPYKQKYYAEVGDLYVMCKYESSDKIEKDYRIYSLFEIVSENRKKYLEDIPTCIENKKGNDVLWLSHKLKKDDMLLLYKDSIDELKDMDNEMLSQRLYVVRGFENPSLIKLVKHINAKADKDLGKGESIKDYGQMPEKIRCSINTLKYLIHGVDFQITSEGIVFKD